MGIAKMYQTNTANWINKGLKRIDILFSQIVLEVTYSQFSINGPYSVANCNNKHFFIL